MASSIVPGIYKEELLDGKISVSTEDAYDMVETLEKKEGILAGQSSAAALCGSLKVVSMVVIGGLGTLMGPVIGSMWVIGLPAIWPENDLVPLFTSSIGLLVLLLYFPGGLVQIAYSARDSLLNWAEQKLVVTPVKTTTTQHS